MNIVLILLVFAQAILFKVYKLNARKLQERGLSPHAIAGLQRYAIFPSIALFALTYKPEYLSAIIHSKSTILLILGITIFWIIAEYTVYFVINSTSSLSLLYAMDYGINLPILAVVGILINNDMPNVFAVLGLVFLLVALLVRPAQHIENKRTVFKYSLLIVTSIIVIKILGHNLDGAFYRNLLHFLSPATLFGISIYVLSATIMLNVVFFFRKISKEERNVSSKNKLLSFSVPALWFIASIPEGYSYANIPLFTVVSISSISFLIDVFSDLKNKRIILNKTTSIFVSLVFISIVLSSISLW